MGFSLAESKEWPQAYKQRVTGSNPVTPTKSLTEMWGFFCYLSNSISIIVRSQRHSDSTELFGRRGKISVSLDDSGDAEY